MWIREKRQGRGNSSILNDKRKTTLKTENRKPLDENKIRSAEDQNKAGSKEGP